MLHLVSITKIPFAGPVVRLGARALIDKEATVSLLAGSPAAISDHIREYVDAGANEIIITLLPPYNRKYLRQIAEDVVPRVLEGR